MTYLLRIMISKHNLKPFKKKNFKNYKRSRHNIKITFLSSYFNQSALLSYKRRNIYINCWEIRDLSQFYFTVDQYMGGRRKTSTHVVTRKVQPSPYLRSKMGTALVVTPKLSGHLRVRMLKILLPCSSTSHSKGTSHTSHERSMRLVATVTGDLRLVEVIGMSYVHMMNHLMVTISAYHLQIRMVT
jgi:hypothetical protein